jgi:hypothetical protein
VDRKEAPLRPLTPATAVINWIEPLEVPEPDAKDNPPPVVAPLPADKIKLPPEPLLPAPTVREIEPAFPAVAIPVTIDNKPESPAVDRPVDIDTNPLWPAVPAFTDCRASEPLLDPIPIPLINETLPPTLPPKPPAITMSPPLPAWPVPPDNDTDPPEEREVVVPAKIETAAPSPVSPEPTFRKIAPAAPPVAAPDKT